MQPNMRFIAAHGPSDRLLTASALREVERETKMRIRSTHGAFWLFYAINRIIQDDPELVDGVAARLPPDERKVFRTFAQTKDGDLQRNLNRVLTHERAGTLAESIIRAVDSELLTRGLSEITLLYDGLDVGFGSDTKSIEMRSRFVNGLVSAVEPLRGSCKRVFFKLFLREDIYSELQVQNQSHLAAAKVELQWKPRDLWILALNLVTLSGTYLETLQNLYPTFGPGAWPEDEHRLQNLLAPFWGEKMEAGNKVSTAVFVQRRTADGKNRLFPRTLVQLIWHSIQQQLTIETRPDRVLRSGAIQAGYREASNQRVIDLGKEYAVLSPYLDGLKGMAPTGTVDAIKSHISKSMGKRPKGAKRGVLAGALHAGPGGWRKVIDRLTEIGVLREYRRAKGVSGEPKYEVALLYRPGLGVKSYGV